MPDYEPRLQDLGIQETAENLYPLILEGVTCLLKWTCPTCGERVTSNDPLKLSPQTGQVIFASGYMHEEKDDGSECGTIVDTQTYRFNCVLISQWGLT